MRAQALPQKIEPLLDLVRLVAQPTGRTGANLLPRRFDVGPADLAGANKPFGVVQQWGFYMPDAWGSVTIGGPAITASGLVFIGGSMDSRVRAIDLRTGEVLWKHLVAAPAVSLPAIYKYKGKQYVTFAVGGNSILTPRVADEVVAFSLP